MKLLCLITAGVLCNALAEDAQVNPLSKTYQLMDDLKAKIVADGEQEDKAYYDYSRWCAKTAASTQNEIETSTNLANKLSAKVDELTSDIEVSDTKIGDLSAKVSKSEKELTEATAIRKKEKAEFLEGEHELMATIDTLERAVSVLEREISAGNSLAQIDTSNLQTLLQSLSTISDAAGFDGSSKDKLLSLVQAHDEDDDLAPGAPTAANYKSHSGGIIDILEDMKDKAETQLAALRKTETESRNSYQLLKQSLDDETAATDKELADTKSSKSEMEEEKASSEGNLEVANKETKTGKANLARLQSECQVAASDHEANVANRKLELKTIEEAEKILKETTGGAEEESYDFLQVSSSSSVSQKQRARELAKEQVVKMVKNLAKQQHSAALAQLASRIQAVLRYGSHGHGDPFAKVKQLISSMIAKLEKEASEEAEEKAYCDEEMAKTEAKKSELEDTVAKLTAKIEKAASQSAQLKEEVAELQSELATLTTEQAEMNKIRSEEHESYKKAKEDLELGLGGVRKALSVLRDFYATPEDSALMQTSSSDDDDDGTQMSSLMQQAAKQPAPPEKAEKATGAGQGIISILEVCESDFAKNLASEESSESDAEATYEKQTQANKVTKAEKEQDVKFKTQEFKALDKTISELEADKSTEDSELSAVNEYYAKIKERCIAKPETYEERKARREAEIQGLKDALAALEGAALVEVKHSSRRTHLRGDSLRTD